MRLMTNGPDIFQAIKLKCNHEIRRFAIFLFFSPSAFQRCTLPLSLKDSIYHGYKAMCSSKQRRLYLVKYCTCTHCRVDAFGTKPLSLSYIPPVLLLGIWRNLRYVDNLYSHWQISVCRPGKHAYIYTFSCAHNKNAKFGRDWLSSSACQRAAPVNGNKTLWLAAAWQTQEINFLQRRAC